MTLHPHLKWTDDKARLFVRCGYCHTPCAEIVRNDDGVVVLRIRSKHGRAALYAGGMAGDHANDIPLDFLMQAIDALEMRDAQTTIQT